MRSFDKFIALTKVDATQREVYGVVTSETPDKEGEICDYASTKPHYEAWSAEFSRATAGKSLGNVREMHTRSAVGKVVDLLFDDAARTIAVRARIVDDTAWTKCEEGVYTGFSHGGEYVGEPWPDGDGDLFRYTARPCEISLVDNPCNPEAHFEYVKADGSVELRKFAPDSPQRTQRAQREDLSDNAIADSDADVNPGNLEAETKTLSPQRALRRRSGQAPRTQRKNLSGHSAEPADDDEIHGGVEPQGVSGSAGDSTPQRTECAGDPVSPAGPACDEKQCDLHTSPVSQTGPAGETPALREASRDDSTASDASAPPNTVQVAPETAASLSHDAGEAAPEDTTLASRAAGAATCYEESLGKRAEADPVAKAVLECRRHIADLSGAVQNLTTALQKLLAEPMPRKTAGSARTITKEQDNEPVNHNPEANTADPQSLLKQCLRAVFEQADSELGMKGRLTAISRSIAAFTSPPPLFTCVKVISRQLKSSRASDVLVGC
jgi:hypothetical protein